MVAACVHGEAASLEQLCDEAAEDIEVTLALVEGAHILLMLLADAEGCSVSRTLEAYCASAMRAAEDEP